MQSQKGDHTAAGPDPEQAWEALADGREGTAVDYDAELRIHNEILRQACGVRPDDHVLDIGCGTGQTTRHAARVATAGRVVGVDISAPSIDHARRLTTAAGLDNVTFAVADAESHQFPERYFDVAISRFGTMFFHDPVAAFGNIALGMRPGARLVMMVWQDQSRNDWSMAIQRALGGGAGSANAAPGRPNPFSLADPVTTERILELAGFGTVTFTDVHQPVFYGQNVAAGLDWVCRFSCVTETIRGLDPASADRVRDQLCQALAAHAGSDGVWLDSRAWIVSAQRH